MEIFNYLKTQLSGNHELEESVQEEIPSNKILWYEIRKLMQIKDDGMINFTGCKTGILSGKKFPMFDICFVL